MEARKKIGFVLNRQKVEILKPRTSNNELCEVQLSPVQMQLIDSIANLSMLIVSPDFAGMSQANKDKFVMQLVSNVELNTELNIFKQYALDR